MRIVAREDNDISLAASGYGAALKLDHMDGFAVSVRMTVSAGTLAGTLSLQGTASDPFTNNVNNTANPNAVWDDIPGTAVAVSTTTTATYSYNAESIYFRGVRLKWVYTSGTATYDASWSAKGSQS